MTDLHGINSQSNKSQNMHGRTIYTVRDSLLSEILLSTIIGITLLSCVMVIKSYILLIDVTMYPQFVTLIVPILHTFVRRIRLEMQFPILVMQLMVPAAFFVIVINIPALQFGNSTANKFYLAAILIAYTLFSIFYRLNPRFSAGDSQFIAISGLAHIVLFILFSLTKLDKASRGYVNAQRNAEAAVLDQNYFSAGQSVTKTIIIHAIIIVILYIIMRQLAVFDAKYFHSINKSTKSAAALLKKQNNKTVIGLVVVIAISLGVLACIPIATLSDILFNGFKSIAGVFGIFFPEEADIPGEIDTPPQPKVPEEEKMIQVDTWVDVAIKILAVLIIIGIILFIVNLLRVILQNAPKFKKKDENLQDDNLTDTIEDISPDKKTIITKSMDFGTGYERRIRKQFYKKVHHAMKKGLPVTNASSPSQIEAAFRANGDDISELKTEYEKVRYS